MADLYPSGPRHHFVTNWLSKIDETPSRNTCTVDKVFTTSPTMDGEDPWNWDVDRIVRELCTEDRTWPARSDRQRLPNSVRLEKALRDNDIDGSTLLTDVDGDVLKDDLDIKNVNERATIKHAIIEFRYRSQKYEEWFRRRSSLASQYGDVALDPHRATSATFVLPDRGAPVFQAGFDANRRLSVNLPTPPSPRIDDHLHDGLGSKSYDESEGDRHAKKPKNDHVDNEEIASFLDHDDTIIPLNEHEDLPGIVLPEETGHSQSQANGSVTTGEKKRKRIAPTLTTSEIDPNRNRDIPTGADDVILNDPDKVIPGVIYTGNDGRKRVVPITDRTEELSLIMHATDVAKHISHTSNEDLQEGGKAALKAAQNIVKKAAQRANEANAAELREGYLGRKMFPIDQIFYGDIGVGKEIPTDIEEDGFEESARISSGRRLYLHNAMKRYLRTPRQIFRRRGKFFSARCPYPSRFISAHQSPSFTLFYATPSPDSVVHATRENQANWPEVDKTIANQNSHTSDDDERSAHFNLPSQLLLGGPSSYDNWDPEFLEKYRHIDGGDEVLPVFGDSEDEGEYDLETWREIEDEFGSQEKPLTSIKKKGLTAEEINAAIDEGIAEMVVKWHKEKLPKRERKAWRKWKSTRNKRDSIRKAQMRINHINKDRLVKMRREILSEIWTSQKAVRKQTRIMEQSICEREDLVWEISILESRVPPEKPKPEDAPVPKAKTSDDHQHDVEDDGESLASTEDESDNDLGDFIVADDIDNDESMDIDAEGGDEDAPLSDPDDPSEEDDPAVEDVAASRPSMEADKGTSGDVDMSDANPPSLLQNKIVVDQDKPQVDFIDLTQLTSDSSSAERPFKMPSSVNLVTPIKNEAPGDDLSSLGPGQPSRFKLKLKKPSMTSNSEVIDLSDSNREASDIPPNVRPSFDELADIAKYTPGAWQMNNDNVRLLISAIYRLERDMQLRLQVLFGNRREPDLWDEMVSAARDLCAEVHSGGSKDFNEVMAVLIQLFEMYAFCQLPALRTSMTQEEMQSLKRQRDKFTPFYARCATTVDRCITAGDDKGTNRADEELEEDETDDDDVPLSATRRRTKSITISTTDDEVSDQPMPHKLRKKKIFENAQARDLRIQDQRRLQEQAERRKVLRVRLAQAQVNVDRDKIIINDSKFDHEGFIYIHDQIAKRIKDHQIDGVRFMWNQILVSNGDHLQGCLLAHTMGLGKTMQVITLLVALAEAAASLDPSVNKQIPSSLRLSKTLVLCPPGLINNWMDELLLWTPDDVDIGQFYKIDATIKEIYRLDIIETWFTEGGILVMGYEMFRILIANKATAKRLPPLSEDVHEKVKKHLLEGPNIIIADEAHKMKNANAALTQATSGFRSKSRIALTGSPLANNVEEYHTMIEWVAPNYLGPIAEFRAKYVSPIQEGLYLDSTSQEKRRSLKMLGVLKEDLAPKVHRADMSVLRDDLPRKTEFIITIPLTKVQADAYALYVRAMQGKEVQLTKEGEIRVSTIWHWLAILSILCNHPSCFRSKLVERITDAKKASTNSGRKSRTSPPGDGIINLEDALWKTDVSESMVRAELELFDKCEYLDAIDNSNKVRILTQILDAARDAKDKVLVFSQSLSTLDYLEGLCERTGRKFKRLDGATPIAHRQTMIKDFNTGDAELYLISTAAGGLGLNIYGANRVVIFDFKFNPILEEQAVGRAYRIGQQKQVFVYRFVAGGTFEEIIHNKTIFKTQLASRVVDKRNPMALAKKTAGEFLFEPKEVPQQDLSSFRGMDPMVLDKILDTQSERSNVRGIVITDTFARDDDLVLTAEEQKEVKQLLSDERLKRSDPSKWQQVDAERRRKSYAAQMRTVVNPVVPTAVSSAVPPHSSTAAPRSSRSEGSRTVAIFLSGPNASATPSKDFAEARARGLIPIYLTEPPPSPTGPPQSLVTEEGQPVVSNASVSQFAGPNTQTGEDTATKSQISQSIPTSAHESQPTENSAQKRQPAKISAHEDQLTQPVAPQKGNLSPMTAPTLTASRDNGSRDTKSAVATDTGSGSRELPEAPVLAALFGTKAHNWNEYSPSAQSDSHTDSANATTQLSQPPGTNTAKSTENQTVPSNENRAQSNQFTGQKLSVESNQVPSVSATSSQASSNNTQPVTPSSDSRMPRSLFNGISPPSKENSTESAQKRSIVAIKQDLKKGHRLGDHVFADDDNQEKALEEVSAAIYKAISRRAESNQQVINMLSRRVGGRLSQDGQICGQLFSGELKPEDIVKRILKKDKHPVPHDSEGSAAHGATDAKRDDAIPNGTSSKLNETPDAKKPFMSSSQAHTPLRRSSRSQKASTSSPHAEADIEYLRTIGVAKRPRISDSNQGTRPATPTTGRPQRNLPQWVLDRLSRPANRSNSSR